MGWSPKVISELIPNCSWPFIFTRLIVAYQTGNGSDVPPLLSSSYSPQQIVKCDCASVSGKRTTRNAHFLNYFPRCHSHPNTYFSTHSRSLRWWIISQLKITCRAFVFRKLGPLRFRILGAGKSPQEIRGNISFHPVKFTSCFKSQKVKCRRTNLILSLARADLN